MNSSAIKQITLALQGYFNTQPVSKAWLFGSYSRGEKKEGSDVDILVSFDMDAKISLSNMHPLYANWRNCSSVRRIWLRMVHCCHLPSNR